MNSDHHSPDWYETLLTHIPGAVLVLDRSGAVRFSSPSSIVRFGYTPEEMRDQPLHAFVHPDEEDHVRSSIDEILPANAATSRGTCRFRMPSGEYHWVEYHLVNLLEDAYVEGILLEFHDISERKQREREIETEKRRMDLLLDVSPDYIFFKDRESRFTRISRSLAELYGLARPEEAIGTTDRDYYPPDDAARFRAIEVEVMDTGRPIVDLEERGATLSGSDRWVSTSKSPIVDADGNVVGTFGISRNITVRKEAERRIQTLLDEKDLILREVHHRIKNDMNLVSSLLSLQAAQSVNEEVRSAITEAGNRITVLSRVYERLYGGVDVRTVDLKPFVEQISEDFGAGSMGHTIDLRVTADEARVSTRFSVSVGIILNELVVNAIKYAFPHVAEPSIEVEVHVTKPREILLVVSDNGDGFPPALLERREFGFGLNIVGSLAEQHQGALEVGNRIDASTSGTEILGARVAVTLCDS